MNLWNRIIPADMCYMIPPWQVAYPTAWLQYIYSWYDAYD